MEAMVMPVGAPSVSHFATAALADTTSSGKGSHRAFDGCGTPGLTQEVLGTD
jgi:hypothetical protein